MNETPLLEVKDLYKNFGKFHVLRGVSVKVRKGELAALIGPNGAGKTTFYNVVSGRYKPTRGQIFLKVRTCQVSQVLSWLEWGF